MIEEDDYLGKLIIPPRVYRMIEKKVVDLFVRNGVKSLPIDPFLIAEREGIQVVPFSRLRNDLRDSVKGDEYDGLSCHYGPIDKVIIFYDDSQVCKRQRFTIFHELGHIALGHKEESRLAKEMANYFAAYASAPTPLIELYGCGSEADVQRVFDISRETAGHRFRAFQRWSAFESHPSYERKLTALFSNGERH